MSNLDQIALLEEVRQEGADIVVSIQRSYLEYDSGKPINLAPTKNDDENEFSILNDYINFENRELFEGYMFYLLNLHSRADNSDLKDEIEWEFANNCFYLTGYLGDELQSFIEKNIANKQWTRVIRNILKKRMSMEDLQHEDSNLELGEEFLTAYAYVLSGQSES